MSIHPMADRPADDFEQNLYRGGELIAAGQLDDARGFLERAHELRPADAKTRSLLGVTYFKLGMYDLASSCYESLLNENPGDASLRVNIGLVRLKSNDLVSALREFRSAVEIDPSHLKAHNYLGLALAQAGDLEQARQHFLEAGSSQMVEKMSRALAAREAFSSSPPRETPMVEVAERPHGVEFMQTPVAPSYVTDEDTLRRVFAQPDTAPSHQLQLIDRPFSSRDEDTDLPVIDDWDVSIDTVDVTSPAPGWLTDAGQTTETNDASSGAAVDPSFEQPWAYNGGWDNPSPPVSGIDEAFAPQSGSTPLPASETPAELPNDPPSYIASSTSSVVGPIPSNPKLQMDARTSPRALWQIANTTTWTDDSNGLPFQVNAMELSIRVDSEILSRMAGLIATAGYVEAVPEFQRARGRSTSVPFGQGDEQVFRIRGNGILYFETGAVVYAPIALTGEADSPLELQGLYLKESAIFAIEESLTFENGLLSDTESRLELVNLRGRGQVLIRHDGTLKTMTVPPQSPLIVPLRRLLGWFGQITPRLVSFAGHVSIELSGEGMALLSTPGTEPGNSWRL